MTTKKALLRREQAGEQAIELREEGREGERGIDVERRKWVMRTFPTRITVHSWRDSFTPCSEVGIEANSRTITASLQTVYGHNENVVVHARFVIATISPRTW